MLLLSQVLGRGGQACVVLARDRQTGQLAAVKIEDCSRPQSFIATERVRLQDVHRPALAAHVVRVLEWYPYLRHAERLQLPILAAMVLPYCQVQLPTTATHSIVSAGSLRPLYPRASHSVVCHWLCSLHSTLWC